MKAANPLRKEPRILMNSPAWIKAPGHDEWKAVLILDVSKSGVRLEGMPDELAKSKSVLLQWPLIPGTRQLECRLKMVRKLEGGIAGLKFEKQDTKLLKILDALVRFHRF